MFYVCVCVYYTNLEYIPDVLPKPFQGHLLSDRDVSGSL